MFTKVLLVAILLSPDGANYKDFVVPFDDLAQCEAAKKDWVKSIPMRHFEGFTYSVVCVRPRAVGSLDA